MQLTIFSGAPQLLTTLAMPMTSFSPILVGQLGAMTEISPLRSHSMKKGVERQAKKYNAV
jgi:hypothetical protein